MATNCPCCFKLCRFCTFHVIDVFKHCFFFIRTKSRNQKCVLAFSVIFKSTPQAIPIAASFSGESLFVIEPVLSNFFPQYGKNCDYQHHVNISDCQTLLFPLETIYILRNQPDLAPLRAFPNHQKKSIS